MFRVLQPLKQRCTGCRICEQWCSFSHYQVTNPTKAMIRIWHNYENASSVPLVCVQCQQPDCISVCPSGALLKNKNTGAVIVNKDNCSGCGLCIKACPNSAIRLHPRKKYALICDLCGGAPQCVKHCPRGALKFTKPEL